MYMSSILSLTQQIIFVWLNIFSIIHSAERVENQNKIKFFFITKFSSIFNCVSFRTKTINSNQEYGINPVQNYVNIPAISCQK